MDKKIWLSSPTMHGDELKYVQDAFDNNWISTVGENIDRMEESICKTVGCKYSVALSSGTASLHLAIKLAGVKKGEKVFCSDFTFSASANAIIYEGGVPVLIGSETDTWNMDPVALEKAFSQYPDVRVVVLVHLYGTPSKIDEILKICNKHKAVLIEDAAESLGSTYKGGYDGTFGKFNCISFNGNKIITGSSGGVLLTNDEASAQKARSWATQSKGNAPWYQYDDIGYNYRMSNIVAGIIRGQIPYLQEHINQKETIYNRYKQAFKDLPVKMNPFDEKNSKPNFWMSCITIDRDYMCQQRRTEDTYIYVEEKGKGCPQQIIEKLSANNIEARPIWKPLHLQQIYGDYDYVIDSYDVSADVFERGLCLPSDNKMTREQQDLVIEIVRSCFE